MKKWEEFHKYKKKKKKKKKKRTLHELGTPASTYIRNIQRKQDEIGT